MGTSKFLCRQRVVLSGAVYFACLRAVFAPADQHTVLFVYIAQPSRAAAHVAVLVRGVAVDERVGRNVACHD